MTAPFFPAAVAEPPETSFDLAIALLNTWDLLAHPPELLRGPESLHRFLTWAGRPVPAPLTADDVARVVAARAVLRQAVEAPNADLAVGLLNALAIESSSARQLTKTDGAWRFAYVGRGSDPCAALIGEAAEGALEAIRDGLWERVGVCAGDPCRCLFVDRTTNRRRRFCCQLCTNRTTQARYRERQKEARRG
jgi:predicted RNA-binding Zn ribbon-like protein